MLRGLSVLIVGAGGALVFGAQTINDTPKPEPGAQGKMWPTRVSAYKSSWKRDVAGLVFPTLEGS